MVNTEVCVTKSLYLFTSAYLVFIENITLEPETTSSHTASSPSDPVFRSSSTHDTSKDGCTSTDFSHLSDVEISSFPIVFLFIKQ